MSEVKRYRVPEKWLLSFIGEIYDQSHNLAVVVLDSDYEELEVATADLTARIASLEREKEEVRDKALDEVRYGIMANQAEGVGEVYDIIRAMKGAKP